MLFHLLLWLGAFLLLFMLIDALILAIMGVRD